MTLFTVESAEPQPDTTGRSITIDVRGTPRPQGSLKMHPTANGKIAARYSDVTYQWRAQVTHAVMDTNVEQFDGPVEVRLGFALARPQGHLLTGKKTMGLVSPSAPGWPAVKPDLDKLSRSILDSCTDAGLWRDDSQVVVLVAAKRYATSGPPGVLITVTEMT